MTQFPLIDHAAVDDLAEAIGNKGTCTVLMMFIDESRKYLATISAAAAPGVDAERQDRAHRAAHTLKSGAGQVGAAALAAAAARVEQAAAHGTPDLAPAIAALGECAAATAPALDQLLAALKQRG